MRRDEEKRRREVRSVVQRTVRGGRHGQPTARAAASSSGAAGMGDGDGDGIEGAPRPKQTLALAMTTKLRADGPRDPVGAFRGSPACSWMEECSLVALGAGEFSGCCRCRWVDAPDEAPRFLQAVGLGEERLERGREGGRDRLWGRAH